jgi:acetoin utilization deacetylase AcuC-like enzyme
MTTCLIYDERFLDHKTGVGHPERPERLHAVMRGLEDHGLLDRLMRRAFDPADTAYVQRLHGPAYVRRCLDRCRDKVPFIDTPDSAICPASFDTALLAAGGVRAAVDAVMAGDADNAFCAVRPPGHHAEADESMGFCLFGNVALAADYLTQELGVQRVAIVDFDVHHGNGTQHLLEHRSDVLFISLHQDPATLYPGTGFAEETGRGEGEGFTLNIPLAPGGGDDIYRRAFESQVLPGLAAYRPRFLLVSAGFDAAVEDPLAGMNVTTGGFDWMSRRLVQAAGELCGGRLVSVLEGGYDFDALARGVAAHVGALLEAGGVSAGSEGGAG